jgi:hypothetical protein
LNSNLHGGAIRLREEINIGMAVALDEDPIA